MVRKIEKIETAVETKFQEYFVNAMALPHMADAFPNLEEVVTLPKGETPTTIQESTKAGESRRRKGETP